MSQSLIKHISTNFFEFWRQISPFTLFVLISLKKNLENKFLETNENKKRDWRDLAPKFKLANFQLVDMAIERLFSLYFFIKKTYWQLLLLLLFVS